MTAIEGMTDMDRSYHSKSKNTKCKIKRDDETPSSVVPTQLGNIQVTTEVFDASSINILFDQIEDALDETIDELTSS